MRGKINAVKPLYRIRFLWKALRELGPQYLGLYAFYRAGLKLGIYRQIPPGKSADDQRLGPNSIKPVLVLPDRAILLACIGERGLEKILQEADEIVEGQVRLFGGDLTRLDLSLPGDLAHWSAYEVGKAPLPLGDEVDIKFIWEPARLGWVFILGRAYHLRGEQVYADAFWDYLDEFWVNNPPYQGPNWISGQEAALRILALVFGAQVFAAASATTPSRLAQLGEIIAVHARRIPPTLCYARAQKNNHLLSEAVGLLTAALALPEHSHARQWYRLGRKWLHAGLVSQIGSDGTYIQHSTNYHRLMLHLALWANALEPFKGNIELGKLMSAANWLFTLTDPASGRVPNLGPNDGTNILPLSTMPYHDYRPVVQAAYQAFAGGPVFPPGAWDELGLWLGIERPGGETSVAVRPSLVRSPAMLVHPSCDSWAYLRAVRFEDRPGHADQLHLDLWWRGFNIAQDAGTYLYNAAPPWENTLTNTDVHNTVMLNGLEQMTRAGRFLYLDWAQGGIDVVERAPDGSWVRVSAWQDGYRRLGIEHHRTITALSPGGWVVEDSLQPWRGVPAVSQPEIRLHWLLPDWEYELLQEACGLQVRSPLGWIALDVQVYSPERVPITPQELSIHRAGQLRAGPGPVTPTWGWTSPTYGVKEPALSLGFQLKSPLPVTLVTTWRFPHG